MTAREKTEIAYSGVCMLKRDKWVIAADPSAMIMLKRIFPRVDKGELGQVEIKRTEEVDRLLQWFLDLCPMELGARDLAQLHGGAEAHRARGRVVRELQSADYVPTAYALAVPPRDYQRVAADMAERMSRLLLADDTGVGKTISAITLLSREHCRPALVVSPAGNMPRQWREQLDRCLPGLRIFTCVGQTPSTPSVGGKFPDVVICPYHLLQYWGDVLVGRVRTVVFDEVQDLRHTENNKYPAARAISLKADFALGMSATPSYNYGGEYFAVLDAINPGCLGTWEEFDREWCVEGGERRKKRVRNPDAFGFHLDKSGLRLRRTRKDVGRELPPLTIAPTPCACNAAELNRIAGKAGALARILTSRTSDNFAKMKAAADLDRELRQATGIGKAPHIAEFIAALLDGGERSVVCFLHHKAVYDLVVQGLKIAFGPDFRVGLYNGDASDRQKQEALRGFKAGEIPVLLMGLRAGSAGLDGLQHVCRTVVHGELDWSPWIHHQATSRIDRDGQPDPVTAYWLLSDEGSDPMIAEVCGAKRQQGVVISDPKEERRAVEQVDVNRATRLAEMVLAQRRR